MTEVGAVYVKVIVRPAPTGPSSARSSFFGSFGSIDTPVTTTGYVGEPVFVTVNAFANAVGAESTSLKVNEMIVPSAFVAADCHTGPV